MGKKNPLFPDDEKMLVIRPSLNAICNKIKPAAKLLSFLCYQYTNKKEVKLDSNGGYEIKRTQAKLVDCMCDEMDVKTLHNTAVPWLVFLGYIDLIEKESTTPNSYILYPERVKSALAVYYEQPETLNKYLATHCRLEVFPIDIDGPVTAKRLEKLLINRKKFQSISEKVLITIGKTSNRKRGRKPASNAGAGTENENTQIIEDNIEDNYKDNIVTSAVFSDEKNDATIADKTVFDLDELPEGTFVYDEAPAPVDQLFIISMDEITGEITNKPANTTRRTSNKYMCPELPDLEQPPTKDLFLQLFSHYKKSPIPTDLRNREAKLADAAAEHLLNAPNGVRKGVTGYSLAEVSSVYRLLLGLNPEEWLQDKDWIDKGLPVTPNAVKNNIDAKLKLIAARKRKHGPHYGQDTTSAPASPEEKPDPYKNLITPEGKVVWTEEGPDYTGNPETGDNWRKFRMMDIDEAIGQYGWSPDEALKYHVWNHIRVNILMEQERVTA